MGSLVSLAAAHRRKGRPRTVDVPEMSDGYPVHENDPPTDWKPTKGCPGCLVGPRVCGHNADCLQHLKSMGSSAGAAVPARGAAPATPIAKGSWCSVAYTSWCCLTLSCIWGLLQPTDLLTHSTHTETALEAWDDGLVRHYGTLLPFATLGIRVVAGYWKYVDMNLVYFVAVSLFRVGFYFLVCTWHYYFSDHIFLVMCTMSMVYVELKTLEPEAWDARKMVVIGFNLVLVAMLCLESYETTTWYHTRQASITAFFVGLAFHCLFQRGLHVRKGAFVPPEDKTERLLQDSEKGRP